ncbi:MAG: T9SS type A sorting domain-containing protein, partial [Prevotella sp.]|nr:T9SS type A sorting domain-containing protein [Prevotella sp.]
GESGITVTLNGDEASDRGLSQDQSWTVEVRSATTGQLMATQSSTSRSETISTAGWPKGIYIVKVTVGKEVLTEKVVVK